ENGCVAGLGSCPGVGVARSATGPLRPRCQPFRATRPDERLARNPLPRATRGPPRMTITNRFDTVSPLDSRFYGGDPALYKALHPYLSAAAAIKYMARVEGALALAPPDAGLSDKATAHP